MLLKDFVNLISDGMKVYAYANRAGLIFRREDGLIIIVRWEK